MLNREHEVLTLSSKIQTDVASSISKTQRDFFLREQMRAIQRELGEAEPERRTRSKRCARRSSRHRCRPR